MSREQQNTQRRAALKELEGNSPLVLWPEDAEHPEDVEFPYLGDKVPSGWERIGNGFVVTPYTHADFVKFAWFMAQEERPHKSGFAITDVASFQVRIHRFIATREEGS